MGRRTRVTLAVVGAALALLLGKSCPGPRLPDSVAPPAAESKPEVPVAPTLARAPALAVPALEAGEPGEEAGVFARAGWGSGPSQLGRARPEEGNPSGPMSFAVDGQGRALVLDQVNGRLVRLSSRGQVEGSFPVPVRSAQDVVLREDGSALVLDRLGDKEIALVSPDGTVKGQLPLLGRGLSEGGAVTGLFVDGQSVYVEREHGALLRVGGLDGTADSTRPELPGRPSRDGQSFLLAGISVPAQGRVFVTALERPSQRHRFTRELQLGHRVDALLLLDSDAKGTVYLAIAGRRDGASQGSLWLVCLEPSEGRPLGQVELPANTLPEETFRDFVALEQGGVLQAVRTEEGVTYRRVHCP